MKASAWEPVFCKGVSQMIVMRECPSSWSLRKYFLIYDFTYSRLSLHCHNKLFAPCSVKRNDLKQKRRKLI